MKWNELNGRRPELVSVLGEIASERFAQDAKWGEQNHPDGTSDEYSSFAEFYREFCDERHKAGKVTWTDILLEEVFEALAEEDETKLRAELVQSAAVIVTWIEAIDRRSARVFVVDSQGETTID